jgi:hypothetical protein
MSLLNDPATIEGISGNSIFVKIARHFRVDDPMDGEGRISSGMKSTIPWGFAIGPEITLGTSVEHPTEV